MPKQNRKFLIDLMRDYNKQKNECLSPARPEYRALLDVSKGAVQKRL